MYAATTNHDFSNPVQFFVYLPVSSTLHPGTKRISIGRTFGSAVLAKAAQSRTNDLRRARAEAYDGKREQA